MENDHQEFDLVPTDSPQHQASKEAGADEPFICSKLTQMSD